MEVKGQDVQTDKAIPCSNDTKEKQVQAPELPVPTVLKGQGATQGSGWPGTILLSCSGTGWEQGAWTTLQRTVEMWTMRLLNSNQLMKNRKLLNGSKVLPSVDEVTLCWYTGNSWLILQDEQFTRGKELSGKMINIVMRKSEARIHNATFTSHKWTEISSWSPGHRSKWDTDKYQYIGPPQAE